ncbi:MAG TPA: type II toxin-antitoxin system RelE/ParE family toxin [Steroidobacteraceae bacterium]|nr:type II toxin-antitoxin system RelE/ParE family toxin [Steroidobacteraceae bacterium]
MTGGFVLTPRAQRDLDEIWDYTSDRWGLHQAETYTRQLWTDIEAVAANPAMGRPCAEVRAGYHKHPSGSHVLFYRIIPDGIDVVRILHEDMDHERHLP